MVYLLPYIDSKQLNAQCFGPTETFQFAIASIVGMTSPAEVKKGEVKVKGEKTSKSKSPMGGSKNKGQVRRQLRISSSSKVRGEEE